MRTLRIVLGTLLVGAVALVVGAGPASAGATYSGTFDSVAWVNCTVGDPIGYDVSGTWSVTLGERNRAEAYFHIYVDGQEHVEYTTPMTQARTPGSETFILKAPTGAGPLTLTLEEGQLRYNISPYNLAKWGLGPKCSSVTYYGSLGEE